MRYALLVTTQEFPRNSEDQPPRNKALITAIANVFHGGDVAALWAKMLARRDAERAEAASAPEEPPSEALINLRFHQ